MTDDAELLKSYERRRMGIVLLDDKECVVNDWESLAHELAEALKSRLREGWISVKDRLPELRQPVALINVNRYENTAGSWDRRIFDCGYLDYLGSNYWTIRRARAQNIEAYTHWMLLPEPPKD